MKNAQQATPWAPDDCPDNVVEMIDIDNQLGALGLRGLASSDSKQIRNGFRQLTGMLRANYLRGRRVGVVIGMLAGAILVHAIAVGISTLALG